MTLRQTPLEDLGPANLTPQAMIARPIEQFSSTLGISITEGYDDLDYFRGAALVLDETISFVLLHHRGDLPNTTIIYLAGQQLDGPDVTKSVNEITRALGVEDAIVTWRRDSQV